MFIHKSIDMENTRCNIELGKDRYVQATEWQTELRIDDREWETKKLVSKLEVPAKISMTESCYSDCETTEPRSAIGYVEVITWKVLRSSS
jgi:hypothetical protein